MEIFKIIAVGIITVIVTVVLKQVKPELAIFVTIAGGLVIVFMLVNNLTNVFDSIKLLMNKTGVNSSLFKCVLKVIGIGYITEFGSNICLDSGNVSIADKIMFAGKITILILCMPVINNLIEVIIGIMQWKKVTR